MRLFLDTNVLVDYFGRREPYFDDCVSLRVMQAFGDAELWASAKSFTDVFYILRKAVGAAELQAAFKRSAESFLGVCAIGPDDMLRASELSWPDFEDCIVAAAAQKVKADYILTRDVEGFSRSPIPAMPPSRFLARMRDDHGVVYDEISLW